MNKYFLIAVGVILTFSFSIAQNKLSIVKGTILNNKGKPAELVNVKIVGGYEGTATNSKGKFEIANLLPGNYTLLITFVGYEKKEIIVHLNPGVNDIGKITLAESAPELEEVLVEDKKVNKFSIEESEFVSKIPIKNLENPQSYSTSSKAVLSEQNIVDYANALKSIPGGNISSEGPTGILGTFIRGFLTNSFIRNGIYNFSSNGGDPQIIERLEIIRGPSGPIYGSWGIGYGGLINKVTKHPFNEDYYNFGLTFGSYNLQRFFGDINLPLNKNKTFLMRINTAVHSENSFQDFGYRRSYMLTPSFYFKISEKSNILLEAELNSFNLSANTLFSGAAALGKNRIDEIRTNYYKSYSSDRLTHSPSILNNYYGQINYLISNKWNFSTSIALADYNFNGSTMLPTFINNSLMSRSIYDYSGQINSLDIQPKINGEFSVGNITNKFLAGFDYQWVEVNASNHFILNADTIDYTSESNPELNVEKLRTNYTFSTKSDESRNSYAMFISNVSSFFSDLDLMLSVRYDYNDYNGNKNLIAGSFSSKPFNQGVFSPQIGISYQLIQNELSLYTNYMQGFNYITANIQNQSFDPEYAEQIEGGVKLNLNDNKYTSTISYYLIKVSNKVRVDPANPVLSIQDGTQRSSGVDVDFRANPFTGLNVILGYNYNESKFIKSNLNVQGNRPLGVPKNMSNLWAYYNFSAGFFSGISAGVGMNYSSSYYFDDANTLTIPSYLILKATIGFDKDNIHLGLTGQNIGSKKYWDYNGIPQPTASLIFNLNFTI